MAPGQFPFALDGLDVAGEKERGGQDEEAGAPAASIFPAAERVPVLPADLLPGELSH
jgi:hypothetical protein